MSQDKNSGAKTGFVDNRNWFQKLCGHAVGMDDVYEGLSQVNTRLDSLEESSKQTQEKLDTIQTEQAKANKATNKKIDSNHAEIMALLAEIRGTKFISSDPSKPKKRTSKKKTS